MRISSTGGIGVARGNAGGGGAGGAAVSAASAARCRSHRTSIWKSPTSAKRTRRPICSMRYPRVPGAGGSPVSAIVSRIDVSACTFFMR